LEGIYIHAVRVIYRGALARACATSTFAIAPLPPKGVTFCV
jgi:hypothetical protein